MTKIYSYINHVTKKNNLSHLDTVEAFNQIMDGRVSDQDLGKFILALKEKGETADEILGICEVLLNHSIRLSKSFAHAIDNCGTGGDQSGSFNISTTSAFIMAGAGITVAKHGNKSITSKSGSSDVLSQLGVNLSYKVPQIEHQLEEIGISFLFAQVAHPKLGQITRVRKQLGVPTLFNLIGPLINPVDLDYQYVGVYDESKLEIISQVLHKLGRKRALVVHGAGKMDEATLLGENKIVELSDGNFKETRLDPKQLGLRICTKEDLAGGNSEVNKRILTNILLNQATPAQTETALLNAALGIYCANQGLSIEGALDKAKKSLESQQAKNKLDLLIASSHQEGQV